MIWVVIIVVLVMIIVCFAKDSVKQSNDIISQGGMKSKYKTLIDLLQISLGRAKITNETNTAITVYGTGSSGSMAFDIVQTFGKVTIRCYIKNAMIGNHQLQWIFDENMDQQFMFKKINDEVNKLFNEQISKLGQI